MYFTREIIVFGEFCSVAIASKSQQADTGTKMVHLGKKYKINYYLKRNFFNERKQIPIEDLVRVGKNASNARNISQCDSLLIGNKCHAHTYPYHEIKNSSANIEHKTTTSKKISDEQLFLSQRGISEEKCNSYDCKWFCKEV